MVKNNLGVAQSVRQWYFKRLYEICPMSKHGGFDNMNQAQKKYIKRFEGQTIKTHYYMYTQEKYKPVTLFN